MRHILAPILLLVLLFPALALGGEIQLKDLVITNGLYFKKFTNIPFTGKVTGREQGSFKDGKKDGPYVSYNDNGQLLLKGTFRDGEKDGPWVWNYDNGQLEWKGTFKNGVKISD